MSLKARKASWGLLAASLGLVWGCPFPTGGAGGGGCAGDDRAIIDGDEGATDGQPTIGATVFADNGCAACHGDDGSGGIGPDIRFVEAERLDEHLRDTASTHFGGLFAGLTDEDLANLAAFLNQAGSPTPEAPESQPPPLHRFAPGNSGVLHGEGLADPLTNCAACHGSDLSGTGLAPSCTLCHARLWEGVDGPPPTHTEPKGPDGILHEPGFADPATNCSGCHGTDLEGSGSTPSCTSCHDQLWPGAGVPANHVLALGDPAAMHREGLCRRRKRTAPPVTATI